MCCGSGDAARPELVGHHHGSSYLSCSPASIGLCHLSSLTVVLAAGPRETCGEKELKNTLLRAGVP